jgi:hypothetical protein
VESKSHACLRISGRAFAWHIYSASALSMTGNQVFEACETNADAQQGVCAGFINGVADGLAIGMYLGKACWFTVRPNANTRQLIDVAVKYHPADRDQGAATLILLALRQAFPCSS